MTGIFEKLSTISHKEVQAKSGLAALQISTAPNIAVSASEAYKHIRQQLAYATNHKAMVFTTDKESSYVYLHPIYIAHTFSPNTKGPDLRDKTILS